MPVILHCAKPPFRMTMLERVPHSSIFRGLQATPIGDWIYPGPGLAASLPVTAIDAVEFRP